MDTDNIRVRNEQLKQLLSMEPFALAATFVNATITCVVMRNISPRNILFAWFTYLLAVTLIRAVLLRYYRRLADTRPHHSRRYCLAGVAAAGIGWGALGAVLYPPDSIPHQAFIAFVLGGMTAGAAVAYSTLRFAFASYSIPALVPLIIRLAATGDTVHYAMAAMITLFVVLMFRTAAQLRNATDRMLSLRFENESLIEQLKNSKTTTDSFNDELKTEVERRRKAEQELQDSLVELQQSNEDLNMFASAASHDLQAPMRRIAMFARILADTCNGCSSEEGQQHIQRIAVSAERMQTLISDLLYYARIGREELAKSPADLKHVVTEVSTLLEVPIQESGTEIVTGDLPTLPVHEGLISSVFQNLLSNAIKFHGEASPRIEVSAKRKDDEWVVAIHDNGIGMEQEHLDSVFAAFRRLHSASDYPGTGIGLAVCKRIIERHGGRMWAESEKGKGSTFYFSLPR